MTLDPISIENLKFVMAVERNYAALMASAGDDESLGGKLLYAGELDGPGRALMVAGNIAGAATLGAAADAAAQKLAIRDGVADFLVTTLDEGLRILKNEIRKRETVAVCIGAEPAAVEREMAERGVLANLTRPLEDPAEGRDGVLVTWRVDKAPALWLPKLDAQAIECAGSESGPTDRWLRLAPRFLGRMTQGMHAVRCEDGLARSFVDRVRRAVAAGEIAVGVEIRLISTKGEDESFLLPAEA